MFYCLMRETVTLALPDVAWRRPFEDGMTRYMRYTQKCFVGAGKGKGEMDMVDVDHQKSMLRL